ncbi:TatD family hydrolase [Patescibacteria group bacterium]|nr:TatD family hydrolase [Patescibacteria group bacterium]
MYEYIDIHSHLYFPDFDEDREEVIAQMKEEKIATISIGTDFVSSKKTIELANQHENLFACIGQHPSELTIDSVFDARYSELSENKNVVAIGECGLDYFRLAPMNSSLKGIQKTIFQYQIDMALFVDKPLMLHIRSAKGTLDAYEEALEILEHHSKISGDKLRGNAHFFAGDIEILKRFLAIGFTVSFPGAITFADSYDELIQYAPINMIMAETDSPFVAPAPHRGERNSPLFVPLVVERIAQVRGESLEEVKKALRDNALLQFPAIAS